MKMLFFKLVILLLILFGCKDKDVLQSEERFHVIESVIPLKGAAGSTVTITGSNFSSVLNYNLIKFGDFELVPVSASLHQLVFNVPYGIVDGNYEVSVVIGGEVTSYSELFVVEGSEEDENFSCPGSLPISPEMVQACFVGNGMAGVHPRLIFNHKGIDRIRSLSGADPILKPTYDQIINKANSVLMTQLLEYSLDGAGLRIPSLHTFANDQVPFLVLAYQFTGDDKYALRCWQQLEKLAAYPDWGANRHFLDAGIAAKGIAIAYDGLFDYLTSEQKDVIVQAVRKHVLEPGVFQIENGTGAWKWYLSSDNWNGICHGGMIMAALATFETDPAFMSKVVALSTNGMVPYIQSLEPDGASQEGMMYWSYGLTNTFLAFESMMNVLNSTYGLTDMNGFAKTMWFPYLVSGPAGTATFGDDYLYNGVQNRFLSYFWFAHHFNDADFAKTHIDVCLSRNSNRTTKLNDWTDLLFYNPDLVAQGDVMTFPLHGNVSGVDYMFVRENYNNTALYVGMHGGNNAASHGHLDAGTFFIQALGETFAVGNLGIENPYPSDYFLETSPYYNDAPTQIATTPGRFYYYRVRTEGKNCLVFNPDARPEQNPVGKAELINESHDDNGGFYVLDMQGAYVRDVSEYKRGIKLTRGSQKRIVVQDEFVVKKNSEVYWIMHTPATDGMIISGDGKTATMTRNGRQLLARIVAPVNATFQKVNRSTTEVNYLPETLSVFGSLMSGKNSLNQNFGKLQIKLESVNSDTPTTIRIDFILNNLVPNTNVVNLQNWTTRD